MWNEWHVIDAYEHTSTRNELFKKYASTCNNVRVFQCGYPICKKLEYKIKYVQSKSITGSRKFWSPRAYCPHRKSTTINLKVQKLCELELKTLCQRVQCLSIVVGGMPRHCSRKRGSHVFNGCKCGSSCRSIAHKTGSRVYDTGYPEKWYSNLKPCRDGRQTSVLPLPFVLAEKKLLYTLRYFVWCPFHMSSIEALMCFEKLRAEWERTTMNILM